jgi:hypothetical protein
MKILALEKELDNARTIDFRKNAKAEAKAVWQLYLKEIVREFYFRKEKSLAVLILEVKNKAEAKKALSKLPFVSKKLIEFELIPLKPYPGSSRINLNCT